MYMHVYMYMYVCIYVCMHVCMHVCMYVHTFVCMYMQAHTCIDEYMNISRLDAVCFEPILSEYDDIGASETDQVKRESESKKGEKYTG